jgi:hypothetical protein
MLYLAKLSFRNEGAIKTSSEKQKLREFVTTRPAIQKMLEGVLQTERQRCQRVRRKPRKDNTHW